MPGYNYGDIEQDASGQRFQLHPSPQGPVWVPLAQGGLIAPNGAMLQPDNFNSLRAAAAKDNEDGGVFQRPFFPTAPRYYRGSGKWTRNYGCTLLSTDADYAVGTAAIRVIRFDIPCTIIARNGGSLSMADGNAFPVGVGPRDTFLVKMQYVQGDFTDIDARLASTVLGTGERPGEAGGDGWEIDQGGAVLFELTPLIDDLRIDVTLVTLEQRGKRNFTKG